jgi:hypothetical protein
VWARTALVALAVAILLSITVGPLTGEVLGRVTGLSIFPYLITAFIARRRPRLQTWGRLIVLYVALFIAALFVILVPRLAER